VNGVTVFNYFDRSGASRLGQHHMSVFTITGLCAKETEKKLSSTDDRGQTDRVTTLQRPHALGSAATARRAADDMAAAVDQNSILTITVDIDLYMTFTFNPVRARVIIHSYTKTQVLKSVS